jgi:hypothetical protein
MKIGSAILGGIWGATVVALLGVLLRGFGIPVKLELLMGSMFTHSTSPGTWLLGFVIQLGVGAILSLVYAVTFESIGRASAGLGAACGVAHALVAGFALALVPPLHPLVPEVIPSPGPLMIGLGLRGLLAFLALHVVYGAIVGWMYAPAHARRVAIAR